MVSKRIAKRIGVKRIGVRVKTHAKIWGQSKNSGASDLSMLGPIPVSSVYTVSSSSVNHTDKCLTIRTHT